jgi:hypothetical protein
MRRRSARILAVIAAARRAGLPGAGAVDRRHARFQTIAALADSGGRSFEHVGAGPARAREDWL